LQNKKQIDHVVSGTICSKTRVVQFFKFYRERLLHLCLTTSHSYDQTHTGSRCSSYVSARDMNSDSNNHSAISVS